MNDTLDLTAALAASESHSALYEIDGRRAFVSARGANFDIGVKSAQGQATRLNQTTKELCQLLTKHNIPLDRGWKSKQREAARILTSHELSSVRAINQACQSGQNVYCNAIGYDGNVPVAHARSRKGMLIISTTDGKLIFGPHKVFSL